ncbi:MULTISPECIES: hypothetical protein [Corallococcus]|uniref:hypothetical protein n=1 Tax=Corallococcus TaxID=83461 RepID=UPI0011810FC7|nr:MULTISPECIES: hypothetical protein [Corallococcus]NBD14361.1 hypothetical protein [Corallococcus silvisoli]TSC22739.1 hypothetical protein FOF48_33050 [Corallococcus sp. Z5C101001]
MRDLTGHRKALGLLYVFVHALTLLGAVGLGVVTWMMVHIATGRVAHSPAGYSVAIYGMVAFTVAVLWVALAGLSLGMGLLRGQSVSRGTATVLAILALANFPVGTVLGIYSLWFFGQEGWDSGPEEACAT